MTDEDLEEFRESIRRCNRHHYFLDNFCDRFINSSALVKAKFAKTDLAQQKNMIEASLYTAILVSNGNARALKQLEHLAELHSQRNMDIGPPLYDLWVDSLIAAVSECDEQFNDRIEQIWRRAMSIAVAVMRSKYNPAEPTAVS